jgi:hypothetical protein
MVRLIIALAAVALVWLLLLKLTVWLHKPRRAADRRFMPTVRCIRCGAYLDRRLARLDEHGYYCREHDSDPS